MTDSETAVAEARKLFNEGKFWHVHEALEVVWLKRSGEEKAMLQGLILGAASLVHLEKEHWDVAWRMMADAARRLEGKVDTYHGWDVAAFRKHLQTCAAQRQWVPLKV